MIATRPPAFEETGLRRLGSGARMKRFAGSEKREEPS
jgi:hypothetical protein